MGDIFALEIKNNRLVGTWPFTVPIGDNGKSYGLSFPNAFAALRNNTVYYVEGPVNFPSCNDAKFNLTVTGKNPVPGEVSVPGVLYGEMFWNEVDQNCKPTNRLGTDFTMTRR